MLPVRRSPSQLSSSRQSLIARRDFLRTVIAGPLLAAGLVGTAGVAIPSAEVVMIVIAVVALALSIYKMFSGGGPSLQDLLRMQMEMLRIISLQLATIQKGIEEILTRLDEVKELIGVTPARTVAEFHKTTIAAIGQLYVEKMDTYGRDVQSPTGGPAFARDFHRADMRKLVDRVSEARAALFKVPSDSAPYLFVPSITSALHIEVHSRILAGDRPNDLAPVLSAYSQWLREALHGRSNSIESNIVKLRKEREDLLKKVSLADHVDRCFLNHVMQKHKVVTQRGGRNSDQDTEERWYQSAPIKVSEFRYTAHYMTIKELATTMFQSDASAERSSEAAAEFREGVQVLLKQDILKEDDFPLAIEPMQGRRRDDVYVEFNQRDRPRDPARTNAPELVPPSTITEDFIPSIRSCNVHDVEPAANMDELGKRLKAKEHVNELHPIDEMLSNTLEAYTKLKHNGLSLIAHAGLHSAATAALAGIDKFERDLEKLQ